MDGKFRRSRGLLQGLLVPLLVGLRVSQEVADQVYVARFLEVGEGIFIYWDTKKSQTVLIDRQADYD